MTKNLSGITRRSCSEIDYVVFAELAVHMGKVSQMRNAHIPRKVSRPWSHLCVALVSLDRLQHGPCLPLRPPCNRPSYAWAHDRRISGGQLHTFSCTGRVSRSISSHGWCGYHSEVRARAQRNGSRSQPASRHGGNLSFAASQQAVTAEISASELWLAAYFSSSQISSLSYQDRQKKNTVPEHFNDDCCSYYSSSVDLNSVLRCYIQIGCRQEIPTVPYELAVVTDIFTRPEERTQTSFCPPPA